MIFQWQKINCLVFGLFACPSMLKHQAVHIDFHRTDALEALEALRKKSR
jgi:hypothetical protein